MHLPRSADPLPSGLAYLPFEPLLSIGCTENEYQLRMPLLFRLMTIATTPRGNEDDLARYSFQSLPILWAARIVRPTSSPGHVLSFLHIF